MLLASKRPPRQAAIELDGKMDELSDPRTTAGEVLDHLSALTASLLAALNVGDAPAAGRAADELARLRAPLRLTLEAGGLDATSTASAAVQRAAPSALPGTAEARLPPGTRAEYYSSTYGRWIPAKVLGFDAHSGTYALDIQPVALASKVRLAPVESATFAAVGNLAAAPVEQPEITTSAVPSGSPADAVTSCFSGKPSEATCGLCQDCHHKEDLVSLECAHLFCRPCLRGHALATDFLRERVACPMVSCSMEVHALQVRQLVGEKTFAQRQEAMAQEDERLARQLAEELARQDVAAEAQLERDRIAREKWEQEMLAAEAAEQAASASYVRPNAGSAGAGSHVDSARSQYVEQHRYLLAAAMQPPGVAAAGVPARVALGTRLRPTGVPFPVSSAAAAASLAGCGGASSSSTSAYRPGQPHAAPDFVTLAPSAPAGNPQGAAVVRDGRRQKTQWTSAQARSTNPFDSVESTVVLPSAVQAVPSNPFASGALGVWLAAQPQAVVHRAVDEVQGSREVAFQPASRPGAAPAPALVAAPSLDVECPLCFDIVRVDWSTEMDCAHRLCTPCFRRYLESKIMDGQVAEDELVCPLPQCKAEITVAQVEGATRGTALWEKFLQFRMRNWRPGSGDGIFVACPTPECGQFVVPADLTTVTCPVCRRNFCPRCGSRAHEGTTCEAFREWESANSNAERCFEELMLQQQWKRCPKCTAPSERESGCNFMQCRSEICRKRTYWCYLCNKELPKAEHYVHYPRGPYEDECVTPGVEPRRPAGQQQASVPREGVKHYVPRPDAAAPLGATSAVAAGSDGAAARAAAAFGEGIGALYGWMGTPSVSAK